MKSQQASLQVADNAAPSSTIVVVVCVQRAAVHHQRVCDLGACRGAATSRLLSSRGSIADYPLGLKSLELELHFADLDGHPVPARSRMDMLLYLPLVLNTRVLSEAVAYDQRFLTP